MSALTVQDRHLTIPQCALFSPSELTIAADCSQDDFVRIVKAIVAIDTAGNMWMADASLHAIKTWDREKGLGIMASATGYKVSSLLHVARVASEFPPSKRVDGFTYNHYRRMLPFPRDWSLEFLKRNAGKGLSSRDIYALAVEEFGSEPYKNRQPKKSTVHIRAEVYARIRPFSGPKVSYFIEGILEEWLKHQPDVPASVVTPEPRPTYAARRKKQLAEGAKPILPKEKKKLSKIELAWIECEPAQFIDSENGPVKHKGPGRGATKFYSEAEAVAAELKHFEKKGYHELVKKCDVCSGGNARRECWHVYHRYAVTGA